MAALGTAPAAGPARYAILIREHLASTWADWFDGFVFTYPAGGTLLTGLVPDQAALHGVLARIRDLNLTLLSVSCLEPDDYPGGHDDNHAEAAQDSAQAAI